MRGIGVRKKWLEENIDLGVSSLRRNDTRLFPLKFPSSPHSANLEARAHFCDFGGLLRAESAAAHTAHELRLPGQLQRMSQCLRVWCANAISG